MKRINEHLNAVTQNITSDAMGITTGFPHLDKITRGLTKGELTLIAGRSSMGKTALMVDIILHISQKYKTGVFSLEMSVQQLVERMIINKQSCSLYDLKEGKVKVLDETKQFLEKSLLWIGDKTGITTVDIWKKLNELGTSLDIVFVDYLQLLRTFTRGQRYEEVDKICQQLRTIAKERNLALVLLAQLNREVERRENHRPRLSDLRESGGIEQTADKILMLYRPAYYKLYNQSDKDAQDDGEGHIIVAKNRNGMLGDIPVVWLAESMSYRACNFELEDSF